jgi:hypothetical protein
VSEAPAPRRVDEARSWLGDNVDDRNGRPVGFAHGFFVDAASGAPIWLVVRSKRRRLGSSHIVVSTADCAVGGGRVWVAHGRDAIRSSPIVDPSRPLLREHELTICAHYGIGERVGRAAEVASLAERSITSQPLR